MSKNEGIPQPKIEKLPQTQLIGMSRQMSLIQNETGLLWQGFMPRRNEIEGVMDGNFYSVEVYPDLAYFQAFNPANTFEKWAAVQVAEGSKVPDGMQSLTIPEGLYAVFLHQGKDSEVPALYQYILGVWLPNSAYHLDNRPHFGLMGEKYKREHPDSEEEFWIPVKEKP